MLPIGTTTTHTTPIKLGRGNKNDRWFQWRSSPDGNHDFRIIVLDSSGIARSCHAAAVKVMKASQSTISADIGRYLRYFTGKGPKPTQSTPGAFLTVNAIRIDTSRGVEAIRIVPKSIASMAMARAADECFEREQYSKRYIVPTDVSPSSGSIRPSGSGPWPAEARSRYLATKAPKAKTYTI